MELKKIITIILCVEVFLVPLFFLGNIGPRVGSIPVLSFNKIILMLVLSLSALVLFLSNCLEQGRLKITRTSLDYFIFGFLVFYTLSFIFSADKYNSLFLWLMVLSLVVFYYLVVSIVERKELLLSLIVSSSVLSCLVFLVSLFFFRQRFGFINTLISQSEMAALAAIAAILVQVSLLREEKIDRKVERVGKEVKKKRWPRLLKSLAGLISLLLFLAVIALINFRIGWLILTAGSLLLIGLAISRAQDLALKKKWLILPIFVSLIGLFFLFLDLPLIYNVNLPAEVNLSQSVSLAIAWKTGMKSLFGTGPGNFDIAFSKWKPEDLARTSLWQLRFRQGSSLWSEMLATLGWPGFLSWTLLAGSTVLLVFLQGSLLPVFLVLLVSSFYFNFSPVFWLLFFTLTASTIKKGESKEFVFKQSPYLSSLISISLIVGIVLAIFVVSFLVRLYLADWYFKQGNFEAALRYNNRLPEYYLAAAEKALQEAAVLGRAGDTVQAGIVAGRAVNFSSQAFSLAREDAGVCERRAWVFEQVRGLINGANDWAIKTYERCLELEPANPFFLQQLGIAQELAGKTDKATETLKQAVELRPEMSVAHFELGRIYFNQGDLDKAEEHFILAIRNAPDYANALYSLALLYERQNKTKEALALYKRVLELNPDSEDVKEKIRGLE